MRFQDGSSPTSEKINLSGIEIDADHLVPQFAEARAGHSANEAQADDAYLQGNLTSY